ncbi:MAG: hypothetical protein U0228_39320 [Myxococcaceae bacterium]
MDLERLRLLCTLPPGRGGAAMTAAQREVLEVLSDEWIQSDGRDGVYGVLLAERLQHAVSDSRAEELGLSTSLARCDVRAIPLQAPSAQPLIAQVAECGDFDFAVRLLAWLLSSDAGKPLHALVARELEAMLRVVEEGKLGLARTDAGHFRLENGWTADVFERHHDFGRLDGMISPDGFEVFLLDYASGPLAELKRYVPPTRVVHEIYGLGLRDRRRLG